MKRAGMQRMEAIGGTVGFARYGGWQVFHDEPEARLTGVVCAILALWCVVAVGSAAGQILDFGSKPTTPSSGDSRWAIELVKSLKAEQREATEAGAQQLRTLAVELIEAGQQAGTTGAAVELVGWTLARHREALDELLAGAPAGVERDIYEQLHTHAPVNAGDVQGVDRLLRDSLGVLLRDEPEIGCGWVALKDHHEVGNQVLDAVLLPDSLDGLVDFLIDHTTQRRLDDQAKAAIAQLIETCRTARGYPAWQPSARQWAGRAARTLAIVQALEEPPVWLNMPARDQLRSDANAALGMMFSDPAKAGEAMDRLSMQWQLIAATEALDAKAQSRRLRDAINAIVNLPEADPRADAHAFETIVQTYLRSLSLLDATGRLPEADAVVRQLRPAYKPLLAMHARSKTAAIPVLPTMLARPEPMNNPAVLGAMQSLEAAADDLAMIGRLNALLTQWSEGIETPQTIPSHSPVATRAMGPMAERVRQLCVGLGKEQTAADSLGALRELASLSAIALVMPGESALRSRRHVKAWQRATGNQQDELLRVLARARKAFVQSFSTDAFADRCAHDALRLRALAAVMQLCHDAALVETMQSDWRASQEPAINAHPAIELTEPAFALLADSLSRYSAEATAMILDGQDGRVVDRVNEIRKNHAAAIVLARLNAIAQRQGFGKSCSVLTELVMGSPGDDAWLAEDRGDLSRICTDAMEAQRAGGSTRRLWLDDANRTATRLYDHHQW